MAKRALPSCSSQALLCFAGRLPFPLSSSHGQASPVEPPQLNFWFNTSFRSLCCQIGRVGSGGYGWDAVAARKPLFTAHSGRKRALIPRKLFCVPEQPLAGGKVAVLPGRPFPAAAEGHRCSGAPAQARIRGVQPFVPGCSGCSAQCAPQGPGDSSPLRLRGGKCCSPHPSFSTRGNHRGPGQPFPALSVSQRHCHTHQSRRKKGELPFVQTALPLQLAPIPSSPTTLSLPLHEGDLATLLVLTQRCHRHPMQA